MPPGSYGALIATPAGCLTDPWIGRPDDPDDPAWRWAPFGDGRGGMSIYLDTDREILRVYNVTRTGWPPRPT